MSDIKAGDRRRARSLFAMMGSSNPQEQATARRKLEALLKRLGLNWNDLAALVYDPATAAAPAADPRDAAPAPDVGANIFPLDLICHVLEAYVALANPHEFVAVTLWAAHTHVHDKFMVTPRLVLTSPVHNCGKTTLLDVLSKLVARPEKTDSITAAGIYNAIDVEHCTLLLDESDNLELGAKAVLRSTLNSGHRKGGARMHMVKGKLQRFSTFAPLALASIGILTMPLMSRSVVIRMARNPGSTPLRLFDPSDTSDLDNVYRHLIAWVRKAGTVINPKPEMPDGVYGRTADNWRPLIAIADATSPAWGARAREAAIHFARAYRDEPITVTLLRDIRTVFDTRRIERITSKDLVTELVAMDTAGWSEWTGVNGNESSRKLSQGQLARALSPFQIRPVSMRTLDREVTSKGYYREHFEKAWAGYCGAGTTEQKPGNVRQLFAKKSEKRT